MKKLLVVFVVMVTVGCGSSKTANQRVNDEFNTQIQEVRSDRDFWKQQFEDCKNNN